MNRFFSRQIALGAEAALTCQVRFIEHGGQDWVVIKDLPGVTPKGALTVLYEQVASALRLELLLRHGVHRPTRFYHERFAGNKRGMPPRLFEVRMLEQDGCYRYAQWAGADAQARAVIAGERCSAEAQKNP